MNSNKPIKIKLKTIWLKISGVIKTTNAAKQKYKSFQYFFILFFFTLL